MPYKTSTGMAKKDVHRLSHAARPGRPRGRRQVGQRPPDAGAGERAHQSYTRTKANDYTAFRKSMELHTNSSNNTIFADADGDIAYFHSNFIPKRDPKFDWTEAGRRQRPGDRVARPARASTRRRTCSTRQRLALQHNNWPWSAAGPDSPKRPTIPAYVETRHRGVAARPARAARAAGKQGLHAGVADRRGVRQLPAGVRRR